MSAYAVSAYDSGFKHGVADAKLDNANRSQEDYIHSSSTMVMQRAGVQSWDRTLEKRQMMPTLNVREYSATNTKEVWT